LEDLVTIGNKFYLSFSLDPLTYIEKLGFLIQLQKLMFHNFRIDSKMYTNYDNVYYSSNCLLRGIKD